MRTALSYLLWPFVIAVPLSLGTIWNVMHPIPLLGSGMIMGIFWAVGLGSIALCGWLMLQTNKLGTEWKAVLCMGAMWVLGMPLSPFRRASGASLRFRPRREETRRMLHRDAGADLTMDERRARRARRVVRSNRPDRSEPQKARWMR